MTTDSNVKQGEKLISRVLLSGVLLALIIASIGGMLHLILHGHEIRNYAVFKEEPFDFKSVKEAFLDPANDHCKCMMQLGILFLIATPIARVASCIFVFARQRDYLYVAIATIVLLVLLYSFWMR